MMMPLLVILLPMMSVVKMMVMVKVRLMIKVIATLIATGLNVKKIKLSR